MSEPEIHPFLGWFKAQYGERPAETWETVDTLIADEDLAVSELRKAEARREQLVRWEALYDDSLKAWQAADEASRAAIKRDREQLEWANEGHQ